MDNNNISSDYIGSMYDDVIDEPILKNKLSAFLGLKKKEHEVMIINNRRK